MNQVIVGLEIRLSLERAKRVTYSRISGDHGMIESVWRELRQRE